MKLKAGSNKAKWCIEPFWFCVLSMIKAFMLEVMRATVENCWKILI
jgi:hypothetical protein